MKEVSVVIPTYNRPNLIKETLESCLLQDFLKEIIVVDDSPNNETEAVIKSIHSAKIKYVKNKKKLGSPFARNVGIKLAKGNYILQNDDDVVLGENYVKALLDHLEKNNCDIIAGRRINMREGETFKTSLRRANKMKGKVFDPHTFYVNTDLNLPKDTETPFMQATMIFKKSVFPKVSYGEGYGGNAFREETSFQLSAAEKGFRLFLCPHAVCYHVPRKLADTGGQHQRSRLNYEYWVLKNHKKFLKKHYMFLNKYFSYNRTYYQWVADFMFYTMKRPFRKAKRVISSKV